MPHTTLDCENCGAPKQCERYVDVFRCEHCGTVHLPQARALDSVVIHDALSTRPCPLGHGPLHHAGADRWSVLSCRQCGGIFADGQTFWKIVEYRRARNEKEPRPPRKLDPATLDRRIECPDCRDPMHAHVYYGPGNFVIDSCDGCSSVWLDHGELREATETEWTPGW